MKRSDLLKMHSEMLTYAYDVIRKNALSSPTVSYQRGRLTEDVVHVASLAVQRKLDDLHRAAAGECKNLGVLTSGSSDALMALQPEHRDAQYVAKIHLELVTREWEESYMRAPQGDELACSNDKRCEGVRIVEQDLIPDTPLGAQGFVLVRFQTPDEAAGKVKRTCDLCVLCLRAHVTATFYEFQRTKRPLAVIIQPYRVALEPNEYTPSTVFHIGSTATFSGFSDPFPRYIVPNLQWTGEQRYVQRHEHFLFPKSVAQQTLRILVEPFYVQCEARRLQKSVSTPPQNDPLYEFLMQNCVSRKNLTAAYTEHCTLHATKLPLKFVLDAWRAAILGDTQCIAHHALVFSKRGPNITSEGKTFSASVMRLWDYRTFKTIHRLSMANVYAQPNQVIVDACALGETELKSWIAAHPLEFQVFVLEAFVAAIKLDDALSRSLDPWWREIFPKLVRREADVCRAGHRPDVANLVVKKTNEWKWSRVLDFDTPPKYTPKLLNIDSRWIYVDEMQRVFHFTQTMYEFLEGKRALLSEDEKMSMADLKETLKLALSVRSFPAPMHWSTRPVLQLYCPACKSIRSCELAKEVTKKTYPPCYDVHTGAFYCCSKKTQACTDTECVPLRFGDRFVEFYGKMLMSCFKCEFPMQIAATGSTLCGACAASLQSAEAVRCHSCGVAKPTKSADWTRVTCAVLKDIHQPIQDVWFCSLHAPEWFVRNTQIWSLPHLKRRMKR